MLDVHKMSLSQLREINSSTVLCKDIAIKITRESWHKDRQTTEIFNLWSTKLFRIVDHKQFATNDWSELIKCFKEIIRHMISRVATDTLNELTQWLEDSMQFLKFTQSILPTLNSATSCCVILGFFTETIGACFDFHEKWSKQHDLKSHLQLSIALLNALLRVLIENTDELQATNDEVLGYLMDLTNSLCDVGERTNTMDLKSTIETWKCAVRLATHCTGKMQEDNAKQLARRPANFLIKEITRNIKYVYREATLTQAVAVVDKCLKVTNFYIKLLGMLATKFKHQHFPCAVQYFDALNLVVSVPDYLKNSPVEDLVQRHVVGGLHEVLQLVYKNPQITEAVLNLWHKTRGPKDVDITIRFLNAAVIGRDCEYLEQHLQVYEDIFKAFFTVAANFVQHSTYNSVIECYAALAILNESRRLKVFLMGNVLTGVHIHAYASMEVLLIVMCSPLLSPKELLNDFRFWRKCNDSFSLCSQNPKHLLVARLLRYAFVQCSKHEMIKKSDVWNEYGPAQLVESSYRFYKSVGLSVAIRDASVLDVMAVRLSDQLFENLRKFESGSSVDNYYKTVVLLKLLVTIEKPPKHELFEKFIELFAKITTQSQGASNFGLLSEACLRLSAKYTHDMSNPSLLMLLKCLNYNLRNLPGLTMPALHELLVNCKQSESSQVQDLARIVHDSCTAQNIGSGGLMAYDFKGNYVPRENTDSTRYKCYTETSNGIHATKRQRLDECGFNNTKKILHELLDKTHELASSKGRMDQEDIALINDIVAALKLYTT